MESVIQYRAESADEPCTHALTDLLRVEETGTLTASELTDHLISTSVNTADAVMLPVLQALNVFLGYYAKSSPAIAMVGRSKSFSLHRTSPKWTWSRAVRSSRILLDCSSHGFPNRRY